MDLQYHWYTYCTVDPAMAKFRIQIKMACYHIRSVRAYRIFYQLFEFFLSCFRNSYERVLTEWSQLFARPAAAAADPLLIVSSEGRLCGRAPGCKHDGVTPKNPLPESGWSECRGPATTGKSVVITVPYKARTVRRKRAGILKSLWGLGTEEEEGYPGPPGYIGRRNSFLGIDSWAP